MNGVRRQRNRPGDDEDHDLERGGDTQRDQADLDGADTDRTGLKGVVDAVKGVVTVRGEHFAQRSAQPTAVIVAVFVIVAVVAASHRRFAFRASCCGITSTSSSLRW